MADVFTKEKRSLIMSKVKSSGTIPELKVRSLLHRLGYRFRVHRKDLPGKPDIVLPKYRTVIFVHGCFWHGHADCPRASRPTSNTAFWNDKLAGNMQRDQENLSKLRNMGWRSLILWTCQIKNESLLNDIISSFFSFRR